MDSDCCQMGILDLSLSIEPQLADAGLVTGSGWGMQSAGAGSAGQWETNKDTAANKPGGWGVS